jgi:hypothetical protein
VSPADPVAHVLISSYSAQPMGSGKTLICLALIRSTLHQETQPPLDSPLHSVVTTLERVHDRATSEDLELLQNYSDLKYDITQYEDLKQNKNDLVHLPFYYATELDSLSRRESRSSRTAGGKRMYLSNATLVVVPSILMPQWKEEISKHLEDTLEIVVLQDKKEMWAFEKLALRDIVKPDVSHSGTGGPVGQR